MSLQSLNVIIVSFSVKFILALVAWYFLSYSLKKMDRVTNFKFHEWINKPTGLMGNVKDAPDHTAANDLARGIYLGARILAMAYLFGSILS